MPSSLSMLPLLFLASVFYKREEKQLQHFSQQLPSTCCSECSSGKVNLHPDIDINAIQKHKNKPFSTCAISTSERCHRYHSLVLFQYRFGEAGLEEMHPGRTQVEHNGRRKAESRGHRRTRGDGVREVDRWKERGAKHGD